MQYKYDYSNDMFFKVSLNEGVYSIEKGPMRLPFNTKNVSGVWNMSLFELIDKGMWKQVESGQDSVVGVNEKLSGPVHNVDPVQKVVFSTWTVEPKTQEEIDAENIEKELDITENAKRFIRGIKGQLFFHIMNDIRVLQGEPKYTNKQFLKFIENLERNE